MQYKIHVSGWLYTPRVSNIYLGWQLFRQHLVKEMIRLVMFVAISMIMFVFEHTFLTFSTKVALFYNQRRWCMYSKGQENRMIYKKKACFQVIVVYYFIWELRRGDDLQMGINVFEHLQRVWGNIRPSWRDME